MTVSVATLGERALRRLGVAIVPEAERPALGAIVSASVIATNALIELGVIAADETPTNADQSLAFAKVGAVHDALVTQSYVRWNSHAIPQAVSEDYTKLTALQMASSFGKTAEPALLPALEQRVRKVSMLMQAGDEATRAVLAVHRNLTAQGLARWTVFDIPEAVEQPYVILAANLLAPSFGAQVDAQANLMAMALLMKLIALPTSGELVRTEYF